MFRQKINRHRGRRLSKEQIAVATVLAEAIGNFSEGAFCAGWLHDIEHELWGRIVARKPDAYERSVKKLHAAAKKDRVDWRKPTAEFLAGLELLGKRSQVWVYFGEWETAIHLEDWLLLHEAWHEKRKQQRPSLEDVWKRIHEPFPFSKSKAPVKIPPMPTLK